MRGNTFGKLFSIRSFGESHGQALGAVIEGVPGGLEVSEEELKRQLRRRAPGQQRGTTSRKESDEPEILSGVFEGKTLGTPITVMVRNTNQRSQDYEKWKDEYRPGHADRTTVQKYGIRDHRGGGRSSGRETLARVIGGYFASLILPQVHVRAYMAEMGPFVYSEIPGDLSSEFAPYGFPDTSKNQEIENYLVELKKQGDSRGGKVRVVIDDCMPGLGEPAFDKLKADLGKALLSIGACVGFSYGLGEEFARVSGQEASSRSDSFGGIEGGISNGERIVLNAILKPTSTVGEKAKQGRHDPCILPRVLPVMESMVKIVLADHYLRQKAYGEKQQ